MYLLGQQFRQLGSGCVAQLVEQLLPNQRSAVQIQSSAKIYLYCTFVYCQLCIEKTKNKEKEAGISPFF